MEGPPAGTVSRDHPAVSCDSTAVTAPVPHGTQTPQADGYQRHSFRFTTSVENLAPLIDEIEAALDPTGKTYEIIAVDDGSDDGSTDLLKKLAGEHTRLRAIFFRKNSGQAAAFDAGFRNASGDIVVTMDADLQNDPKDIPALIEKLETGFDVVSGWRKDRKDGALLRKIPSRIANWMIRWMTGTKIHDLGCSLKVYRKHVTDEMQPLRRDAPLHLGARREPGRQGRRARREPSRATRRRVEVRHQAHRQGAPRPDDRLVPARLSHASPSTSSARSAC